MKPTPSKRHPSRFAIDGNRYTYAESTGNDTAWIVKLGSFYNIKTVELKFRHISSKLAVYLFPIRIFFSVMFLTKTILVV